MKRAKKIKPRNIPPGIYDAKIKNTTDHGDYIQIEMVVKGFAKPIFIRTSKGPEARSPDNEIYVGEGKKFYVFHTRTRSYTGMGASCVSHAHNKATLLWKGLWSFLQTKEPNQKDWTYVPLKEFNKIIREDEAVNRTL